MKTCNERWREELVNHTLGSPASAALTEHLEKCAVCTGALREWQARMGQIDTGIRQLADSEPSTEAIPRVTAALSVQPRHVWVPEWRWVLVTLSGLTIVIVASIYVWNAHQQRNETEKALLAASAIGSWRSPTEGLLHSSSDHWLKAPPQLGQYFYQLHINVPEKEKEKP